MITVIAEKFLTLHGLTVGELYPDRIPATVLADVIELIENAGCKTDDDYYDDYYYDDSKLVDCPECGYEFYT